MKTFKGKALYAPSGAAKEYSYWAVNYFVGCSTLCTYCYNKTGRFKHVFGGDKPTLKICFKDEGHAIEVFEKELLQNLTEVQEYGIFFSFTTDPMIAETVNLTIKSIDLCQSHNVPVKVLTKTTDFLYMLDNSNWDKSLIAVGFTLTGHDELEPNASANTQRVAEIFNLRQMGFKTFVSIEPIIDLKSSYELITKAKEHLCNHFKIGLMSGVKYDIYELRGFINSVLWVLNGKPVYFKDSLLKLAGIERSQLPENCVSRDYNIFKQ